MSNVPEELKYTKNHEWLKPEGGNVQIGISDHAQGSLGDITFVELPDVGASFDVGETFGVVESVKAASDLYMPVAGEVIEVNQALEDAPESINEDPYGAGWIIRLKLADESSVESLLSASQYKELL